MEYLMIDNLLSLSVKSKFSRQRLNDSQTVGVP